MKFEIEEYYSRLVRIHDFFGKIIKEVFTNICSCEEAELHSFFIEKTRDSEPALIYPDSDRLPYNMTDGDEQGNNAQIKSCLQERFSQRKYYIMEESETDSEGGSGSMCRVVWVLFSECLDNNYGRMVLKCFFHQMTVVFNDWMRKETCIPDKASGQITALVQFVSEKAEEELDFYLKRMFSAFPIFLIDELSGQYYEKGECVANMVFLPRSVAKRLDTKILRYHFEETPFLLNNARFMRKLTEIARKDLYLVMKENDEGDFYSIIGLCEKKALEKICRDEKERVVSPINVRIRKHMQWDLLLNKTYIFTRKNGHYKIERSLQEEYLQKKLTEYFGVRSDGYRKLIENVILSTGQGHGTMLVIMKAGDAAREAKRLCEMQYGLLESSKPMMPKREEINSLNAIDGSVMMDTAGRVHGIGMILDGMSNRKGSVARGARYNSAEKYISWLQDEQNRKSSGMTPKAMILIVSEDGSVEFKTA